VKLEDFWDGWLAKRSPDAAELANLESVFEARSISYSADDLEIDNTYTDAQPITLGHGQSHTIYAGVDSDFILFTTVSSTAAQQYTIKTSNLRNGADTYLTLYNSSGSNIIAYNDNSSGITYTPLTNYDYYDSLGNYVFPSNDTSTLSSRVQLTLEPGTYYVSVQTSPDRPKSAGRYGSYSLTISTP
jgi:hypothetical protein